MRCRETGTIFPYGYDGNGQVLKGKIFSGIMMELVNVPAYGLPQRQQCDHVGETEIQKKLAIAPAPKPPTNFPLKTPSV